MFFKRSKQLLLMTNVLFPEGSELFYVSEKIIS